MTVAPLYFSSLKDSVSECNLTHFTGGPSEGYRAEYAVGEFNGGNTIALCLVSVREFGVEGLTLT